MAGRTILLVVGAVTVATAAVGQSLKNLMLGAWFEEDNGAYVTIEDGGKISIEVVTHGAGTAAQTRQVRKGTLEFGQCSNDGNITVTLSKTRCCYAASYFEGRMTWVLQGNIRGICKREIAFHATA